MGPPNCCKRLTKRRLFARAAIAALEQSTLDGRHAARSSVYKIGRRRAAVSVAVFSRFAIYANVVGRTGLRAFRWSQQCRLATQRRRELIERGLKVSIISEIDVYLRTEKWRELDALPENRYEAIR